MVVAAAPADCSPRVEVGDALLALRADLLFGFRDGGAGGAISSTSGICFGTSGTALVQFWFAQIRIRTGMKLKRKVLASGCWEPETFIRHGDGSQPALSNVA